MSGLPCRHYLSQGVLCREPGRLTFYEEEFGGRREIGSWRDEEWAHLELDEARFQKTLELVLVSGQTKTFDLHGDLGALDQWLATSNLNLQGRDVPSAGPAPVTSRPATAHRDTSPPSSSTTRPTASPETPAPNPFASRPSAPNPFADAPNPFADASSPPVDASSPPADASSPSADARTSFDDEPAIGPIVTPSPAPMFDRGLPVDDDTVAGPKTNLTVKDILPTPQSWFFLVLFFMCGGPPAAIAYVVFRGIAAKATRRHET